MSLLKVEPPQPVRSLPEMFAIAFAMEREAATRYAKLAERMRAEGDPALAEVFAHLSAEESGHVDSVVHWSERQSGEAPDPAFIRWNPPETFDDEGVAEGSSQLLSAYRALSMAVRNEERAFSFWSYVAAQAEVPEIRKAAETMAHEELQHVAILRRERRRAYHAERAEPRPGEAGRTAQALPAATLERCLAGRLRAWPETRPGERIHLDRLAGEAERNADDLAQAPFSGEGRTASGPEMPDDPVALAELLVDRYLEAAESAADEDELARAQDLAARAINRLSWLRADLSGIGRG